MTRLNAANNAQALLVGDITAAATSFYVDDASVFPTAPFMISIDNEIIRVDTVLSNLLSVTRAQEGTIAAAHVGDSLVENRWTAGMYDDLASKDTILSTVLTGLSTAVNAVITAADTILGALGKLQAQISAHKADKAPHANIPVCRVTLTGDQSIADSTETAIAWNAETWDNDTMHDNSTNNTRITITTAGKYKVACAIEFVANTTGFRTMFLKKNGAYFYAQFADCRPAITLSGASTVLQWSDTLDLAANDYLEIYVVQGSGGALGVRGGAGRTTYFGAERLV